MMMPAGCVHAFRHPRPRGHEGRCIGHTDLPVDPRKLRRLARTIRRAAHRQSWQKVVFTSPLQRCRLVGYLLRRWGWQHHVEPALAEMHFGQWDGRAWVDISEAEVQAWTLNFADHAPGGGECLAELMARVRAWQPPPGQREVVMVAHAGWMLARRWLHEHGHTPPRADQWPRPPRYTECWSMSLAVEACTPRD